MFSLERWQEVFETISKNMLRTFLTGVSVGSGIFILIILLGVSVGMQNGIEKQFKNDASNIINIYPGTTNLAYKGLNPGRRIQFTDEDYELALGGKDEVVYKSSVYQNRGGLISYKKEFGSYRVQGVMPDFQYLENASIIEGRFINQNDVDNSEKYVVIGNQVKKDLFKDKSPLGEYIIIRDLNYKVVGVFTDPGGDREESRVFLPITTTQVVSGAGNKIRSMGFTLPKIDDYDEALAISNKFTAQIERQLKAKLLISPLDTSGMSFSNNIENTKNIYQLISAMKIFFWFVGIATLMAGIIGVSNIMLIIVKERTKEIGIRKALGARPMSIIGMVLHESIFVTAFSGIIGLILGLGLLEIVGPMFELDFMVNPSVDFSIALTTVVILVVAGAFAGFFPAWRGAKIKPIDALRDE
ncbi:macrolide efflux ABC-type transporter, permease protein MacB_PCD superfamily [Psychroflexus torquis ATCC 700755]|uniref:Macrolide efflux ABC-type transporter, permease protein MacB_PCD superfamily n=1 Tax=Psychroflexus torquis (strain ATCC 700755 / CIP 106069 / ACAM 623) TaxID=313595 RepID=K4IE10_PSYTT|nr:ABC transporter permease [Psychroflexus torquis]AFU68634.1 macrolide efflux ABC-type transporter, permease protein MacB_PCD superfamily [Psychroflexus torquis ATCC 700755]